MDIKNHIINNNICADYAAISVLGENKCILLTGQVAAGEAHLLKVIADEYIKHFPTKKVKLEVFEDLMKRLLKLVKDERTNEFYDELISNDLILIENMDAGGKVATQKEVAHWISKVITSDKNIIISTAEDLRNRTVLTDTVSKMCGEQFVHMAIGK